MDLKSEIESILFIHGEPLAVSFIAKITERSETEVVSALEELEKEYSTRGIRLIKKDGEYQIGTAPENARIVEKAVKSEFSEELSKAALETLAIIAYKGPLTRAEIEHIRGVNSSFILRNLLMRGLVERIDNPKDARSFLYRLSFDSLKYLGLTKAEDLPDYGEFHNKEIEILDEAKG